MDSTELECSVCNNIFSNDYYPMILSCSHTFCACCIEELISRGRKNCPICRVQFTVSSAKDLTVNRSILNVAKQITSNSPKMSSRRNKTSPQWLVDRFKKERFNKTIEDFQSTEAKSLGALKNLDEMIERLQEVDKQIVRVLDEMQKAKPLIEKHLKTLCKKAEVVKYNMDSLQQEKENLQESETKLENSADYASAGIVMGEVEEALQDSQEKLMDFNILLQENENERQQLEKEIQSAEIALKDKLEDAIEALVTIPMDEVAGKLQSMTEDSRLATPNISLLDIYDHEEVSVHDDDVVPGYLYNKDLNYFQPRPDGRSFEVKELPTRFELDIDRKEIILKRVGIRNYGWKRDFINENPQEAILLGLCKVVERRGLCIPTHESMGTVISALYESSTYEMLVTFENELQEEAIDGLRTYILKVLNESKEGVIPQPILNNALKAFIYPGYKERKEISCKKSFQEFCHLLMDCDVFDTPSTVYVVGPTPTKTKVRKD